MQWVVVMYSIWFVISPSLQTMLFLVKLDQRFKSHLTVFLKCPHVPTEYPSICPSVWSVQASSICTSKLNILVVNCCWPSWKETFSWDEEGTRVSFTLVRQSQLSMSSELSIQLWWLSEGSSIFTPGKATCGTSHLSYLWSIEFPNHLLMYAQNPVSFQCR